MLLLVVVMVLSTKASMVEKMLQRRWLIGKMTGMTHRVRPSLIIRARKKKKFQSSQPLRLIISQKGTYVLGSLFFVIGSSIGLFICLQLKAFNMSTRWMQQQSLWSTLLLNDTTTLKIIKQEFQPQVLKHNMSDQELFTKVADSHWLPCRTSSLKGMKGFTPYTFILIHLFKILTPKLLYSIQGESQARRVAIKVHGQEEHEEMLQLVLCKEKGLSSTPKQKNLKSIGVQKVTAMDLCFIP